MSSVTTSRLSLLFLVIALFSFAQSIVPPSAQFKFVNKGKFGDYIVEYGANYRALSIFNLPFHLCFYNTTPNAFTLAVGMGHLRPNLLMRWVWEANRGNPVSENASFSLGADGNLVLANADGRVVWQTNTANKGVVGFKILPDGNMVLHDSKNNSIWQSFDGPITDTILVGQSFRSGFVTKLVSRASEKVNANGPYSMVLESDGLGFYYQTKNSPKPYKYYLYANSNPISNGTKENVTLKSYPNDEGDGYFYFIEFQSSVRREIIQVGINRSSTLTFMRLGVDGNLRFLTFRNKANSRDWETTLTLLSPERDSTCQLPGKCRDFGLCKDNECVACPSPSGLKSWTENCEPPKVPVCGNNNFGYYKLEGVDHFMTKFNMGDEVEERDCENKCSKDCKCLGYFYNKETSRCWTPYDLNTLTEVANSSHVGYIKFSKE